ncbi:NAD(P)/FAD-dependent oxidoreductase [Bradyrhizobium prioriisuperbiae]|uniref:NAD(P)/FAD-dependent oxidoreductase n=1 Tax=Bradyrhizobium prioriisuperbiae TaxID=2854389 RepID=UPI0028F0BECE|nr:NAD(P)/FAD-dependent oxidoreductase [Bradyrhizobium prioritasuperba]
MTEGNSGSRSKTRIGDITPSSNENLSKLARQARFEMDCLGYPARSWVLPRVHRGQGVPDAVIVGGGQSGTSIAFRLLREQVSNVRVLDRSSAGMEGPWSTFARMHSLRTPKHVTGPDLGIPSLSAEAWWEAKFGRQSWLDLDKVPRTEWHHYLNWVRDVAGIDVTNNAEVFDIEPLPDGLLAVHANIGGGMQTLYARNVVLATGIEGSGSWTTPKLIEQSLPRHLYAHTSEAIDFTQLSGQKVVVIGAGASAFDNAATALEHGAASVELLVRRKALPVVNPNRWMEFAGFLRHFGDLDDARKWTFMKTIFDMNQPPPQETFDRCAKFPNFSFRLWIAPDQIGVEDGKVAITVDGEKKLFDFLIAGTGFTVDLGTRKELARFSNKIALWSDRYTPPPGEESAVLGAYPYLSANFQFTEKVAGSAPFLRNMFCYTFAAMPSLACSAGISALKFGVERVAAGISRALFVEDADSYLVSLKSYNEVELDIGGPEKAAPGAGARVA